MNKKFKYSLISVQCPDGFRFLKQNDVILGKHYWWQTKYYKMPVLVSEELEYKIGFYCGVNPIDWNQDGSIWGAFLEKI